MKRRLIQLTTEQEGQLAEISAKHGQAIAAQIRTAVDMYLQTYALAIGGLETSRATVLSPVLREWIYARDEYTCQECARPGRPGRGPQSLQVHHRIAGVEGGTHSPENLITLCKKCHSKADRKQRRERDADPDKVSRPAPPRSEGWLTVEQAAERLGLTPIRIRQLIRSGKLPAGQFGKAWVLTEADLAAFTPTPRGWPKGVPRKAPAGRVPTEGG